METAEIAFFQVQNLTPEIWGSITCLIPGEQIGQLKLTGSKSLWNRLCSPRSVRSITLGYDFLEFCRWPAFLNELPSIEELSISSASTKWWDKLNARLYLMPKTLKTLNLSRMETLKNFFLHEDGTALSLSEHLPNLESLTIDARLNSQLWLEHCPPSLTFLQISDWNASFRLPSTLLHLSTNRIHVKNAQHVELPPNLETLTSTFVVGMQMLAPALPQTLTKLCCGSIPIVDNEDPYEWSQLLPKSLTQLKGLYLSSMPPKISDPSYADRVMTLPPFLTDLEVSHLPSSDWVLLPPTLTRCRLTVVPESATVTCSIRNPDAVEHTFKTIPLNLLPISITELAIACVELTYLDVDPSSSSEQVGRIFPSRLTNLLLSNIQLTQAAASQIPTSLTHLRITNLDAGVCQRFPRNLKSLIADNAIISPTLIRSLPPSLLNLELKTVRRTTSWIDPLTGRCVPISRVGTLSQPGTFSGHPGGLNWAIVNKMRADAANGGPSMKTAVENFYGNKTPSETFDWAQSCPLPSTLTSLKLETGEEMILDDSFFQQPLPFLHALRLCEMANFTDSVIPLLPKQLKILVIRSSNLTAKCFADLPRSLTQLEFQGVQVHDADIVNLPRNLENLAISDATELTNACLKDLPRTLENLYAYGSNIDDQSSPEAPYKWRSKAKADPVIVTSW